ncbi:hypothetical protein LAZ40_09220 [Cereibacter sphaeroides]|nr:hypothetical protein [Cereibacter sphaeroides]MCE6959231.1 hypothetical protein [Cereibacter sphaeroides]MCE6972034.1 hypothetical protein [Cereibacter sphaeroides]
MDHAVSSLSWCLNALLVTGACMLLLTPAGGTISSVPAAAVAKTVTTP